MYIENTNSNNQYYIDLINANILKEDLQTHKPLAFFLNPALQRHSAVRASLLTSPTHRWLQ